MFYSALFGLLIYVVMSTIGVTLIKYNISKFDEKLDLSLLSQIFNTEMFIGIILYFTGFMIWLYVLSQMKLSTAYPLAVTLSVMAVMVSSSLFLKEKISIVMIVGVICCVFGILLIVREA